MSVHKGETKQVCQGGRLDESHDALACHAQGEKRNDIIRALNCWINTIENQERNLKKQNFKEPCRDHVLCYPQFKCEEGLPESKKPQLRVTGDSPSPLIPANVYYKKKKLWKRDDPPMAAWERPRVRSSQLVAGEFRRVRDCFRANGLNEIEYCPRTKSCQLMRCLDQMIEEDRKLIGPEMVTSDCCCRPEDTPSRIFKCYGCGAPSKCGHKDKNYLPEMGSHGGYHQHDAAYKLAAHQIADNYPQASIPRKNIPQQSHVRSPKDPRAYGHGHGHGPNLDSDEMWHDNAAFLKGIDLDVPPARNINYAECLTRNYPRESTVVWKDDVALLKEITLG